MAFGTGSILSFLLWYVPLLASRDSNLRLSRHSRTEGCEPQK